VEINNILKRSNLALIDQEFASRPLPETIVESLGENHNIGNQFISKNRLTLTGFEPSNR